MRGTRTQELRAIYDLPEFRDPYMSGAIKNAIQMLEEGRPATALTLLRTVKERICSNG